MNNPSLLNPLPQQGFYELEFTPLFDPNVLIFDKDEARPSKLRDDSKGIFVIVDTQQRDGGFYVYVGQSGVWGDTYTFFDRLIRIYGKDGGLPDKINDSWDKAILLFDWKKDIEKTPAKKGGNSARRTELIDQVMDNEVLYLEKFLHDKLKESKDLKLNVLGEPTASFFMPNPDLSRYDYYVGVVKELLQIITGQ